MRYSLFTISLLFSLLIVSCSSDEEPIDFSGEYRSTALIYTECDDSADNGPWRADDRNRFCYIEDDTEMCFRLVVRLSAEGTYERIFVDEIIRGGFSSQSPEITRGDFTADGRSITLCPDDGTECYRMTLNEAGTILNWRIQGNTCVRTYDLTKS